MDPVLRQNSVRRDAVDLPALIRRRSWFDDHSPAPAASPSALSLRWPPPARDREPCPASATRRVQEDGDPAPASHDGSSFLGRASQDLGRVRLPSCCSRGMNPRTRMSFSPAPLKSPGSSRTSQPFTALWSENAATIRRVLSRSGWANRTRLIVVSSRTPTIVPGWPLKQKSRGADASAVGPVGDRRGNSAPTVSRCPLR